MSHTPGPWDINDFRPNEIVRVDNPDWVITTVSSSPNLLANARLIAAAPELLEACELAHEFIDILEGKLDRPETYMIAQFSPILAKLYVAIAKAKGE